MSSPKINTCCSAKVLRFVIRAKTAAGSFKRTKGRSFFITTDIGRGHKRSVSTSSFLYNPVQWPDSDVEEETEREENENENDNDVYRRVHSVGAGYWHTSGDHEPVGLHRTYDSGGEVSQRADVIATKGTQERLGEETVEVDRIQDVDRKEVEGTEGVAGAGCAEGSGTNAMKGVTMSMTTEAEARPGATQVNASDVTDRIPYEVATNGNKSGWKDLTELQDLLLMEELEMRRLIGRSVPEGALKEFEWETYRRHVRSSKDRAHYLLTAAKRETRKQRKQVQAEINRRETEEKIELGRRTEFKNTFFLHLSITSLSLWTKSNLYNAELNGPHLVIDFSFHELMLPRNILSMVRQVSQGFSYNRRFCHPFHIHGTGVVPDSSFVKQLARMNLDADCVGLTLSQDSYDKFYDKDRLVYLSPDALQTLDYFDEQDVYIIGGLVDAKHRPRETYAKAKSAGLRMARFPLDRYVKWVSGSKSLTLDQVIMILVDLKRTGSWPTAVKNIPKRKVTFFD